MAILKGITCHVLVNDIPVQEYDDELDGYQGESHITKFIESVSEARFKVNLTIPLSDIPSDELSFNLYIDGQYVTGKHTDKSRLHSCKGLVAINDVIVMNTTGLVRKPFIFNEIKRCELKRSSCRWFNLLCIVEEATPASAQLTKASLDGVGTITVKVQRCVVISRDTQYRSDHTGLGKIKEIPEKKLKGMSLTHSAKYTLICFLDYLLDPSQHRWTANYFPICRLGLGTPTAPEALVQTRNLDTVPYAHFDFKYCSRSEYSNDSLRHGQLLNFSTHFRGSSGHAPNKSNTRSRI